MKMSLKNKIHPQEIKKMIVQSIEEEQ